MSNLEQIFDNTLGAGFKLHGELCLPRPYAVKKSAEFTTNIAIQFFEWCNERIYRVEDELSFRPRVCAQFPDYKEYVIMDHEGNNILPRGKFLSIQELFEYFIENYYGHQTKS